MQSWLSEERYSPTYNWLVQSKSLYLKHHEKNPVNWLEWCSEAFSKAKREDKPVLISIGYLGSELCNTMNRESYADEEIACLLNERFITIKVDREERPDISADYMNLSKGKNKQMDWPLNIFMTPEQKPFYTCTYIPKNSINGKHSFKELIIELYNYFQQNRDKIERVDNATEFSKMNR